MSYLQYPTNYFDKLCSFNKESVLSDCEDTHYLKMSSNHPDLNAIGSEMAKEQIFEIEENFKNPQWVFENFNCDKNLPAPSTTDNIVKIVDNMGYTIFVNIEKQKLTIYNPNRHKFNDMYPELNHNLLFCIPCINNLFGFACDTDLVENEFWERDFIEVNYDICGFLPETFSTNISPCISKGWDIIS